MILVEAMEKVSKPKISSTQNVNGSTKNYLPLKDLDFRIGQEKGFRSTFSHLAVLLDTSRVHPRNKWRVKGAATFPLNALPAGPSFLRGDERLTRPCGE